MLVTMLEKIRVHTISKLLESLETCFFYPKLQRFYRELNIDFGKELLIIDVGANKGQSIKFFQNVFDAPSIIAFEPLPAVQNKLTKLASSNTIISDFAISQVEGKRIFYQSSLNETSSFIRPSKNSEWQKIKNLILGLNLEQMYTEIQVNSISLDKFMERYANPQIGILKIDVEGAELDVLKSSFGLLSRKKIRIVQLERHESDLRENLSKDIFQLLSENDFRLAASLKHSFGNFFEDLYVLETQTE